MAIFVCYHHEDKDWVERLRRFCAHHIRRGQIELWDNNCIDPGRLWLEEIRGALGRAKVAVLLISGHFFNSGFIAEYELPRLLEAEVANGLTILPLHIGVTNFHLDPVLSQFQAFNPNKPLKMLRREAEREEIIAKFVEHILGVIASDRSIGSPRVVRVTDPEGDDLREIWDLHNEFFPDEEVADSYEDMQRWIADVNTDIARPVEDRKLDDIMLALKSPYEVIDYLYAQHYIHKQTIFVSYIGYDKTIKRMRNYGAREFLIALIEHCEKTPVPWQFILGEVEQVQRDPRRNVRTLFRTFRQDVGKLMPTFGSDGKLFKIASDYRQPRLHPI